VGVGQEPPFVDVTVTQEDGVEAIIGAVMVVAATRVGRRAMRMEETNVSSLRSILSECRCVSNERV